MAKYHITEDLYWRAVKVGTRRVIRKVLVLLVLIVLVFSLLIQVSSRKGLEPGSFATLVVVALVFFVLVPVLQRRTIRKIYRQQKSLQNELTLTVSDEGMHWESPAGSAKLAWDNIYKWATGKGVLVIYESQALMRIVPLDALSDAERALMMSRLQSVKRT